MMAIHFCPLQTTQKRHANIWMINNRAIVGAGRYDMKTSDEGKFYAVVLEQVRDQISMPEKK
jgi:hypothetical protein